MTSRDTQPPPSGAPDPRTVTCPACGGKAVYEPWNPWRPFCSQRCRVNDLGAWASESYRIPAKPGEDEPADGSEEPEN